MLWPVSTSARDRRGRRRSSVPLLRSTYTLFSCAALPLRLSLSDGVNHDVALGPNRGGDLVDRLRVAEFAADLADRLVAAFLCLDDRCPSLVDEGLELAGSGQWVTETVDFANLRVLAGCHNETVACRTPQGAWAERPIS